MCIAAAADAGELVQLALERHEVGDHFDGLERRRAAVDPAGELVQVVADARDLAGALALGVGRRRGSGAGPRHGLAQQVRQRHAGGSRGAQRPPSPAPMYAHWVGWLMAPRGP